MAGSSARQNPAMSLPDRGRTLQAFGKMDFIATIDIIMNDTAWFSDVVLPEASYLERYDPLNIVGDKAFIRQPVIEPRAKAIRPVDLQAAWPPAGLERLSSSTRTKKIIWASSWRRWVSSLDAVRQKGYAELPGESDERPGLTWNTPSGKIEMFSTTLRKVGFAGVPNWEEPPRRQAGQFYLLTGKVAQSTQFGTQNNQLCTNMRMNRACG